MKISKQIEDCAIIKVDLLNIESSANQPQLKSLLSQGWEVVSSLPIEDGGRPYLLIILRSPDIHQIDRKISLQAYLYLFFLALISILLFLENYV